MSDPVSKTESASKTDKRFNNSNYYYDPVNDTIVGKTNKNDKYYTDPDTGKIKPTEDNPYFSNGEWNDSTESNSAFHNDKRFNNGSYHYDPKTDEIVGNSNDNDRYTYDPDTKQIKPTDENPYFTGGEWNDTTPTKSKWAESADKDNFEYNEEDDTVSRKDDGRTYDINDKNTWEQVPDKEETDDTNNEKDDTNDTNNNKDDDEE